MRDAFKECCYAYLDDASKNRATLPPLIEGIGLRSALKLALLFFLASVYKRRTSAASNLLCGGLPDTPYDSSVDEWENSLLTVKF